MKAYFTAAILQNKDFSQYYKRIAKTLEKIGYTTQHDHITKVPDLSKIYEQDAKERQAYYKKAIKWINDSSIVVAEASFPSTLNIGHEISLALERSKPVVLLYKKGFDSPFLTGYDGERLVMAEYTDTDLEEVLEQAIDFAQNQSDTRFNFFISPRQQTYLDWISKNTRVPRSVYLRDLIKNDMKNNPEFR